MSRSMITTHSTGLPFLRHGVLAALLALALVGCGPKTTPKVCDPDQAAPHKKDDPTPFGFCPVGAPADAGVDAPIADAPDAG